jgi:O-antigen/teichoic acid export membrane protein
MHREITDTKEKIDYVIYFISALTSAILSFYIIKLIVQNFGTEIYGEFTIQFNTILIFLSLCYTWINQSVTRYDDLSMYFKVNSYLIFIFTSIFSFAIFIIFILFNKGAISLFPLYFGIFFVFAFLTFHINLLQSRRKSRIPQLFDFFKSIFYLLFILFFIHFKCFEVEYILTSILLSALIPIFIFMRREIVLGFLLLKKNLSKGCVLQWLVNSRQLIFSFLKYGLSLGVWIALASALNTVDRIIITSILGASSAGSYSAGYDLINKPLAMCTLPLIIIGTPKLRGYWKSGDLDRYKKTIINSTYFLFIMTMLYVVFLFFFQYLILDMGFELLKFKMNVYLILGSFFFNAAIFWQKYLEFNGRQLLMVIIILVCLITNACLNFIFIGLYGLEAACFITMFTSFVYLLSVIYFSRSQKILVVSKNQDLIV